MDSIGSLVDTNLRIYPTKNLLDYCKTLAIDHNIPINIARLVKGKKYEGKHKSQEDANKTPVHLDSKDVENLNKIKEIVKVKDNEVKVEDDKAIPEEASIEKDSKSEDSEKLDPDDKSIDKTKLEEKNNEKEDELHLTTSDIDWLYTNLQSQRNKGDKNVPYLHILLEGACIETPENQVLKRNPILEARCVKLRAQQEAREYRKMTKSVDNVRMRFPEDSISYQSKYIIIIKVLF